MGVSIKQRYSKKILSIGIGWLVGIFIHDVAFSATFSVPVSLSGSDRPAISMQFEEANPNPETLRFLEFVGSLVSSEAETTPLPPHVPASPPVQWRLIYRNIYPGIDLAAYRAGGRVQYDLIVSPGADLSQVKITYQGLEHVELQGSFPGYQIIGGARVAVPVKISRSAHKCYVLEPAPYDSKTELVIPTTQTPLTAITSTVASR